MPRLIDADALLRELREELGAKSPALTDAQNEGIDCGLRIAIKDVKSQPTIDPESLRATGEWIDIDGNPVGMVNGMPRSDCYCSRCHDYLTGSSEYPAKGNYCPNCGAKMKGADPCTN